MLPYSSALLLLLLSPGCLSSESTTCSVCNEYTGPAPPTPPENATAPVPCSDPDSIPCPAGVCYDLRLEYRVPGRRRPPGSDIGNETIRERGCAGEAGVTCDRYALSRLLIRCTLVRCYYESDDPYCENEVVSGVSGVGSTTTSAVLPIHAIGSLLCVLLPWI